MSFKLTDLAVEICESTFPHVEQHLQSRFANCSLKNNIKYELFVCVHKKNNFKKKREKDIYIFKSKLTTTYQDVINNFKYCQLEHNP